MAKQKQLDDIRPVLDAVNDGVEAVESVLDKIELGADKATDILEGGLEKVADVVPETLDKGVHVVAEGTRKGARALSNPKTMAALLSLSGVVLGAGLGVGGYFLLKKRLEKKFEAELEERLLAETEKMRIYYTRRNKTDEFATPESAVAALIPESEDSLVKEAVEALDEYEPSVPPGIISQSEDPRTGANSKTRYDKVESKAKVPPVVVQKVEEIVTVDDEPVIHNVFQHNAGVIEGWDPELEEANRDREAPYVISHDEFMENAFDHPQSVWTYYGGDDTLADDDEQRIDDVEAMVGVDNLARFGHGSRDSSIVYIRNERAEMDLEVVLSEGKFSEEVLGFEHSEAPRIRKGRRGDDG